MRDMQITHESIKSKVPASTLNPGDTFSTDHTDYMVVAMDPNVGTPKKGIFALELSGSTRRSTPFNLVWYTDEDGTDMVTPTGRFIIE